MVRGNTYLNTFQKSKEEMLLDRQKELRNSTVYELSKIAEFEKKHSVIMSAEKIRELKGELI